MKKIFHLKKKHKYCMTMLINKLCRVINFDNFSEIVSGYYEQIKFSLDNNIKDKLDEILFPLHKYN